MLPEVSCAAQGGPRFAFVRRWWRLLHLCLLPLAFSPPLTTFAVEPTRPVSVESARRILFIGDSITYAGDYVTWVELGARLLIPGVRPETEFLNLGLPSETVSGLSEAGHAGGAFPRPDVHERLGRVLEQVRPDLVLVCYGMNDGIYFPPDEERQRRFRDGMERLRARVTAAGARVVHVTPPVFDPVPLGERTLPAGRSEYPQPYRGYDEVLAGFSSWLLSRRADGWSVIDVHGPMAAYLAQRRQGEPAFHLAGDGVHPNAQGHWLIAREILRGLGAPEDVCAADSPAVLLARHPRGEDLRGLLQGRQVAMRDAWLTATRHQRPGIAEGRPIDEARHDAWATGELWERVRNAALPGKRSEWFGFDRYDFEVEGKPVLVVAPRLGAPGRPWVWHGEFFGHRPDPDLALLGRGFHVVYTALPDQLGSPAMVAQWNALYRELTTNHRFGPKPALVGLSRGGLYVYNWAAANPTRVGCIYGDAPVCDFKSWPGGKGKGPGSARDWQLVLERYGFASEAEALAYRGNPVDNLEGLARAGVPLLHVYGDADEVVPWDENTGVLAERYRALGGSITLIPKPGVKHHPHGLENSTPIVEFIQRHASVAPVGSDSGPRDQRGQPLIRKTGTIDLDLVEATPVVFNGRVWRLEWVRDTYWGNPGKTNHFRFVDVATGERGAPFAERHEFGSSFVHGDEMIVSGTEGRDRVNLFVSRDLRTWEKRPVIAPGRYGIFNTSLCRTADDFVLMFEIDRPAEEAGVPFTARFVRSPDLRTWTLTPPECQYSKDRYTAPHALRWHEGWFYNFYLEAHQGYEMRVVRSRNLVAWEPSPLNPVLHASPADRQLAGTFTPEQRQRIATAVNLNNSDLDFCEWQGRLVITYSWGNQLGVEHLAGGVYDGTLAQFLRGWFPAP